VGFRVCNILFQLIPCSRIDRPWNLNQFFAAVSRNQFQLDYDLNRDGSPDVATVTITPDVMSGFACADIRNAANAAYSNATGLNVNIYQHVIYVGPSGWICGSGLGSVGSASSTFGYVCVTDARSTGTMVHEVGHNIGFQHSNALRLNGAWSEYSDTSCPMGITLVRSHHNLECLCL
jgi:Gametolysin peptidase M11